MTKDKIENQNQDFVNLTSLYYCLNNNKEIPKKIQGWLLKGLTRLSTGDAKTLDESWNLNGVPGYGTVGTRLRKFIRDQLLRKLHQAVGNASDSKWKRARLASQELKSLSRRISNISKKSELEQTQVENILFQISKSCQDIPDSPYFIYQLTQNP
ncbi:MAG: hypothetical protein QM504_15360 [Pseudomonadota bacterium]